MIRITTVQCILPPLISRDTINFGPLVRVLANQLPAQVLETNQLLTVGGLSAVGDGWPREEEFIGLSIAASRVDRLNLYGSDEVGKGKKVKKQCFYRLFADWLD